jgi:hypothetical protein
MYMGMGVTWCIVVLHDVQEFHMVYRSVTWCKVVSHSVQ